MSAQKMEKLFKVAPWVQFSLAGVIFLGLLFLASKISQYHAYVYLGIYACFAITLIFRVQFGFQLSGEVFIGSSQEQTRSLISKNDVAKLAQVAAGQDLPHVSPWALLPAKSLLIAVIFLSEVWWAWILLGVVVVQVLAARITKHLVWVEISQRQAVRDEFARTLLTAIRSGKPLRRRFLIYLRPFTITGKHHPENPVAMRQAIAGMHRTDMYSPEGEHIGVKIPVFNTSLTIGEKWGESDLNPELERVVEKGVRKLGDLIALGRPGESLGAGRIETSENNWREALTELCVRADGFVIVPSAKTGTLWEIEFLKRTSALKHCYFLLPGCQDGNSYLAEWRDIRTRLLPVARLPLPPVVPAMFALDSRGRPHAVALVESVAMTAGKQARFFPDSKKIEFAMQILKPIADRSREEEIDGVMEKALQFLDAFSCGPEELIKLDTLTQDLRAITASGELGASEIVAMMQKGPLMRRSGTEEFHYARSAGRVFTTVRQEVIVDDKAFVFFIAFTGSQMRYQISGFHLMTCEEDEQRRVWMANLVDGKG